MNRIKLTDDVILISGKDKGKIGKVTKINGDRVFVEGAKMVKKHTKGNPATNSQGGIIEKESSIHISNVMLYNDTKKTGDRVGIKILEDGKKVRFFKSDNEVIDI
jgi:large subunit ribosomal protein L24